MSDFSPETRDRKRAATKLDSTPTRVSRGALVRYSVALLCILTAFVLRYATLPYTANRAVFLLFMPAVMIASWYGGIGPGLLAVAAGLVLANYFFLIPNQQWNPFDPEQLAAAIIYLFATLLVVGLSHKIRSEQSRVADQAEALRKEVEHRKAVERELREKELRLRLIFENARGVAIMSLDRDGNITDWSEGAESMFGYPREEILGKYTGVLFPPEERAKGAPDEELRLARERGCCSDERWHVGKDGARVYASEAACAKYDEHGQFVGYLKLALNMTDRAQAQEALAASEERFRAIFKSAAVGISQIDVTGRFMSVNPKYCEITGYSADELRQRTFFDITVPEDRIQDQEALAMLRAGELPIYRREKQYIRKDGSIIWVRVTGSFLHNGRNNSAIAVVEDINAEKQALQRLRDSEERMQLTAELADIGMWEWDVRNDMVRGNPIVSKHVGLMPHEKLSYQKFISILHSQDIERMAHDIQDCVKRCMPYDGECRVIWPDGSVHWIWLKGSPISGKDGDRRFVGVVTEVTARKQAEAELREAQNALARHAQELEHEVRERTHDLQRSLQEMEGFCYTIAHDLRAPVRAMRGVTAALEEDYGPQLDDTAKIYCERIATASERMDQLITDLLAYGRLTHTEISAHPVDLVQEIEKVLHRTSEQIHSRHAIVEVDRPLPRVCAYASVLDQVLENLVTNAIKFVPPERQPEIHIYAQRHEHHVRICVDDNGIGIDPEHQERIFGPFQRLHTDEQYPGTGIGLAIVQKGIEKMGGHVGVQSEPGKGSHFWIELPDDSECVTSI